MLKADGSCTVLLSRKALARPRSGQGPHATVGGCLVGPATEKDRNKGLSGHYGRAGFHEFSVTRDDFLASFLLDDSEWDESGNSVVYLLHFSKCYPLTGWGRPAGFAMWKLSNASLTKERRAYPTVHTTFAGASSALQARMLL